MSRFTTYFTASIVAVSFSLPSLAHAKGSSSHSSHCGSSSSSQSSSCQHCCNHDGKCGTNSGTQFYPGGVPVGQGPTGTPSNPGTLTKGNKFAGLAGQNFQVNAAGSYNRENALMSQNFQVNKAGRHVTATVTGTVSRETSDWGALGEALQGLGDSLNDLNPIDLGFHGPPVNPQPTN